MKEHNDLPYDERKALLYAAMIKTNNCLDTCIYCYIHLLALYDTNGIDKDNMLTGLRNSIAKELGFGNKEIQNVAEQAALRISKHQWSYEEAFAGFCEGLVK